MEQKPSLTLNWMKKACRCRWQQYNHYNSMTQEERWQQQYEQMIEFMETNHRRPSKHRLEEHDMLNWFKATKKRIAKGELSEERLKKFNVLLEVADKYRRLNQYK